MHDIGKLVGLIEAHRACGMDLLVITEPTRTVVLALTPKARDFIALDILDITGEDPLDWIDSVVGKLSLGLLSEEGKVQRIDQHRLQ